MSFTSLKMADTSDHPENYKDETQSSSTTPRLALFSFPKSQEELKKKKETTTSLNSCSSLSPIYTSLTVSIPFQWEEAPGKPRMLFNVGEKKSGECDQQLELPPRLFGEARVMNMASPTTVLEGPYIGRSLSLRKGESWGKKVMSRDYKGGVLFGSARWSSGLTKNREAVDEGLDLLSTVAVYGGDGEESGSGDGDGGTTKVKMTRLRRRGSFFSLSQAGRSNILTSIYEGIKQVVPKSRRQEKTRKMKMSASSVASL